MTDDEWTLRCEDCDGELVEHGPMSHQCTDCGTVWWIDVDDPDPMGWIE